MMMAPLLHRPDYHYHDANAHIVAKFVSDLAGQMLVPPLFYREAICKVCSCLCIDWFVGFDAVRMLLSNEKCGNLQHFVIYQQQRFLVNVSKRDAQVCHLTRLPDMLAGMISLALMKHRVLFYRKFRSLSVSISSLVCPFVLVYSQSTWLQLTSIWRQDLVLLCRLF